MKKTALVLEGGAMRGMYSAAVLDVLMEEGIKADAIYATSAGVLFGVNYISGQRGREPAIAFLTKLELSRSIVV